MNIFLLLNRTGAEKKKSSPVGEKMIIGEWKTKIVVLMITAKVGIVATTKSCFEQEICPNSTKTKNVKLIQAHERKIIEAFNQTK